LVDRRILLANVLVVRKRRCAASVIGQRRRFCSIR